MQRVIHGIPVVGEEIDGQSRCLHYHTDVDIIAIRFPCCQTYYPCRECHDAAADHKASTWVEDAFAERAVLCGACGYQLSISEYLNCKAICPSCRSAFNPKCKSHYHLYFDIKS